MIGGCRGGKGAVYVAFFAREPISGTEKSALGDSLAGALTNSGSNQRLGLTSVTSFLRQYSISRLFSLSREYEATITDAGGIKGPRRPMSWDVVAVML